MALTITKKDMDSVYGKTYTDILKITKSDLEKVYGSSQPATQPTKTETPKYGTVNGEINLPYHINNQELYTPPGEKDMVTAALEGFGLAGSNFFKNIANLSDNAKAVFAPAVQTYKEIRPMINDVRKAGQITDIAKAKQQEYGAGSQFESDIVQKIKAREEAQDLWTQQVYDNHKDVKYGDKIINFAYNAGNAVPSVLAGAATASPAVGKLVYGLNTFGGDIGEAVDDGASLSQATNYATADTALQLRLSNLSGGMPFLGNGKISVNGLTDKYIQNEALRWLLNRAFDSAGEGAEEVVTELINPYLKRATYDKDAPNATSEQLWNSFKGGANTAALFGIASDIDKVGSTFDKNDLFYRAYSESLHREMETTDLNAKTQNISDSADIDLNNNSYYNKNEIDILDSDNVQALSLRFMSNRDNLYRNLSKVDEIEGYEDISCHADPYSFGFVNPETGDTIQELSAEQFAKIVKESGKYKGGKIRLISCQSGALEAGLAQKFADAMGTTVLAPTKTVYTNSQGYIVLADNLAEGKYLLRNAKEKWTPEGWKEFKPRR